MNLYNKNNCFLLDISNTCNINLDKISELNHSGDELKHMPKLHYYNNVITVYVGEVKHPMVPEHYIEYIILETSNGFQVKRLKPNAQPEESFTLIDDTLLNVYIYCNIHGLWKLNVEC